MHPAAAFRHDDRALLEAVVAEVGFGMVFLTTPDGPRVAHVPLLSTGDGAVQFHLSRGNALARWIDGAQALAVVNGPDAYVSPAWYADQGQVPTWNYVAVEMEGRVRRMTAEGLHGLLETVSARHEERVNPAAPWTMDKVPPERMARLLDGIIGFELEIAAWRPTFKLSQNKPAEERARVAAGLDRTGAPALAELMRRLAP
ncbi:FMN-binding negative transcriptional regulator [Novosphingobium piscinae]|uniref:FMN-binding negative transcriptional regulator n=1 Tax=Novosphingobium piscinae TaxID=1507448 RepID=A0A7X1G0M3_9SPHN|nr:FMN-binding negative transcriptional regulator [Novosphingobium piscinae]MBC2670448.1 FMN-binding negative transcriptional regulator [Novosphingobium piscinae]